MGEQCPFCGIDLSKTTDPWGTCPCGATVEVRHSYREALLIFPACRAAEKRGMLRAAEIVEGEQEALDDDDPRMIVNDTLFAAATTIRKEAGE